MIETKRKAGRPAGTFKRLHPTRQGGKVSKTFSAYQAMISRCHNPSSQRYNYYGARGIAVCDRWRAKDGYDNFVTDIGVAPEGKWLERKDNSKGYSKENCCWATPKEQAQNREQGGKKNIDPTSLRQRSIAAGLPYSCVYQRVKIHGWDEATALSTPKQKPGTYKRR